MYCNRSLLFIVLLMYSYTSVYTQIIKLPEYSLETTAVLSSGRQTPFWLMSNQYGILTPDKFNSFISVGLKANLSTEKKFDYSYGLDVIDRQTKKNELILHQAYFQLKFYAINFTVGTREEKFGNQDSSLSSGGLLWSGNAPPMPKVSLEISDYIPVPFTAKYLELKGGISHGWFGNNQYIRNAWLHHKYFYFQLGGALPAHIHFGFHHFAQWGGESTNPEVGKMPHGFGDFIKVFFARQGGKNSPVNEQLNALGNHLGSRNFGVDAEFKKVKAGVYWQTIFEDSSGKAFRNIKDGLWGIYIHSKDKERIISGFVYEFLNTTNQSGKNDSYWLLNGIKYFYPVAGGVHHWPVGNDDYFNNSIYRFGWTFHDLVIGTPLITSPVEITTKENNEEYVTNNKITCHHIGLEGKTRNLQYKLFVTYSLNFGTNNFPFKPAIPQYSFLLQTEILNKLPWGIIGLVVIGVDHGKYYGNNTGFRISLLKKVNK